MTTLVTIQASKPPANPWQWMLKTCLPFWAERGVHPVHGGFIEYLNPDLSPALEAETRLRVQARQVYAFSHAYGLTGDPQWSTVASRGLEFLTSHGWDDALGGWLHRLTPEGAAVDRRRDAYDHAFVLFALAHYARWVDGAMAPPLD